MAEVDARIPLMVSNPQEVQQQIYRNQLAQLQVQQGAQEAQQRNALLDIFKQPGAVGENGMPTQATLGKVYQANPQAGVQLANNLADYEQRRQTALTNQIHQHLLGLQISDNQHDRLVDIATSAQTRYEDLVSSGTPPAEAARISGKERNDAVTQAQQDGTLLPQQANQVQGPFNPETNRAFISSSQQYKRVLDEREAARKGGLAEQREERMAKAAEETPFMKELAATYGKDSPQYNKALRDRVTKETGGIDASIRDSVAKAIADYDEPPMTGNALKLPANADIMAKVKEFNPDFNAQEYKSRQTALTNFTSGKKGDTVRSLNVSLDHLDTLVGAGKALKNGNIQGFNRLAQTIAEQTGSKVPTDFEATKNIVADEVIKGIIGAGGGVGDREKAQAIFDKAKSPEQLAGSVDRVKQLLRGQLKGLEKQYKASTGRSDFQQRFLSESTQGLEQGAPKRISSKAEFDALPSGTEFINPLGERRRKP